MIYDVTSINKYIINIWKEIYIYARSYMRCDIHIIKISKLENTNSKLQLGPRIK